MDKNFLLKLEIILLIALASSIFLYLYFLEQNSDTTHTANLSESTSEEQKD